MAIYDDDSMAAAREVISSGQPGRAGTDNNRCFASRGMNGRLWNIRIRFWTLLEIFEALGIPIRDESFEIANTGGLVPHTAPAALLTGVVAQATENAGEWQSGANIF
jgi:hypothetical protein